MRGTDVTDEQMYAAGRFLAQRGWPADVPQAVQSRADIVRLLAWYGQVRYEAGAKGINSATGPGPVVPRKP